MPRQAKRDSATLDVEAPPSKKSSRAAVSEPPKCSVERPRRSCRSVDALQSPPAPPPLAALRSRATQETKLFVKEEPKLRAKEEGVEVTIAAPLPLSPKPTVKGVAAVDEHCPLSSCTHV